MDQTRKSENQAEGNQSQHFLSLARELSDDTSGLSSVRLLHAKVQF